MNCGILHVKSQKISGGDTAEPPQKRPRDLDPDTNFRLARQRSQCSCFTQRLEVYSHVAAERHLLIMSLIFA